MTDEEGEDKPCQAPHTQIDPRDCAVLVDAKRRKEKIRSPVFLFRFTPMAKYNE